MSIRDQEDTLFAEWRNSRDEYKPADGFIPDGVVSEDDYNASNPKIVIILKEPHGSGKNGWDLRKFVGRGAVTVDGKKKGSKTFNNVARWVHGIRLTSNEESNPKLKNFPAMGTCFREVTLKSVCVMNLKKSPGRSSSKNNKMVQKVAFQDQLHIRKQYTLYNPDITICCGKGTFNSFRKVAEHGEICNTTKNGIRWYARDTGKYVIAHYHPNAKVKKLEMFDNLIDAIKEIQAR